ncbi:MAG: transcription termination factor NusA [Patescibacteria group bacterium]
MVQTEFSAALNQVCSERGLEKEKVVGAIKEALLAAFRKDHPGEDMDEVTIDLDSESGGVRVLRGKEDITPAGFGRIAAQTAKQVITQRLREDEKDALVSEFKQKIGTIAQGHIFRLENGVAVLDLGKTQALLPPQEQTPNESYQVNQQIRVLIKNIREGRKGPEIIVSRRSPAFVEELFALEVPEIDSGTVTIESVAREAGKRTKIAAASSNENIDPVGSLVGQKGTRVQAVLRELGPEKIDIIEYNENVKQFIANALSPAEVTSVETDEEKETATVQVPEDQLSLAIGKGGQNVRLAAKLTGWRIDIQGPEGELAPETELESLGLPTRIENTLKEADLTSVPKLRMMTADELSKVGGIGPKSIETINEVLEESVQDVEEESVDAEGDQEDGKEAEQSDQEEQEEGEKDSEQPQEPEEIENE